MVRAGGTAWVTSVPSRGEVRRSYVDHLWTIETLESKLTRTARLIGLNTDSCAYSTAFYHSTRSPRRTRRGPACCPVVGPPTVVIVALATLVSVTFMFGFPHCG